MKRKPMKLNSLDEAFATRSDLFAFLTWEVLKKAKLLYLIGIYAWFVFSLFATYLST